MAPAQHIVFHCMGIPVHLTLVGVSPEQAHTASARAEAVFRRWDDIFSRFTPDSELTRLNARTGQYNDISDEMLSVMRRCLELARETDGLVDPSVGGYLAAAGYGLPADFRLPNPVPDWHSIQLEDSRMRCAPGQILEPAAIVKGMAMDDAGRALAEVPAWMLNAGGDILTHGDWPGQGNWNVGIQHPTIKNAIVATVALHNEAIATSGDYEVRREVAGIPWHHQIDMRTGKPTNDLASVSVIAPTAEEADTIASIIFLSGAEKGSAYADAHGVPYVMIDAEEKIKMNADFQHRTQKTVAG